MLCRMKQVLMHVQCAVIRNASAKHGLLDKIVRNIPAAWTSQQAKLRPRTDHNGSMTESDCNSLLAEKTTQGLH